MNTRQLQLGSEPKTIRAFEIVVQIRDHEGNPTGRTKAFSNDDPAKIAAFWNRMKGKPKRKQHYSNKNAPLPKSKEADSIVKDMASYAKEVRQKKRTQQEE